VIAPLNDVEKENLQQVLDGKNKPLNATVQNAANQWKTVDDQIVNRTIQSGMGLRTSSGKLVPWQPVKNYWPHIFTPEALENLGLNSDFKEKMMAEVMTPADIDQALKNSRRFGERIINPQKAREANFTGYRTDMGAMDQHLSDLAHRVVEAENYGPMDIADSKSPLSQMIQQSNDPMKATDLMKSVLNRDEPQNPAFKSAVDKINKASSFLNLSLTALSHINSPQYVLMSTNLKSFLGGLKDITMDWPGASRNAMESGALHDIFSQALHDDPSALVNPSNLYGIHKVQNFFRTFASAAAQRYANDLFDTLKSGNGSEKDLQAFKDLVLEDPEKVLKQNALTDVQIKRAGGRGAQLANGLANRLDLPPTWSGNSLGRLLTLFHRFSFNQAAVQWDFIKKNPLRSLGMIATLGAASGETEQDVKRTIVGAVKGAM